MKTFENMLPVYARGVSWDTLPYPGDTLREAMDERNLTADELADHAGFERGYVAAVLGGKAPITAHFARALDELLGIPVDFWLRLQGQHDLVLFALALNAEVEK